MKIKSTAFLLLISKLAFAQVNFENEKTLIDKSQMSFIITEIITADFNGDNKPDLLTNNYSDGSFLLYPNIEGSYANSQPKTLVNTSGNNIYPTGVNVMDVNNDGLSDIIFCDYYQKTISWLQNLGNFSFSSLQTLKGSLDSPKLCTTGDIDMDGKVDIVISSAVNSKIFWLKNNGDGTFAQPKDICNTNYDVQKILLVDLNNDKLPEIITGEEDGQIYYIKNSGNGLFSERTQIAYALSGISFDFEYLNNDVYPDLVVSDYFSNDMLKFINKSGTGFYDPTSFSLGNSYEGIKFSDLNNDGLKDIIGCTGNKIFWLKNLNNGNYDSPVKITDKVFNGSNFIMEDINQDKYADIIVPSYCPFYSTNCSDTNGGKLSVLTQKSSDNPDRADIPATIARICNPCPQSKTHEN